MGTVTGTGPKPDGGDMTKNRGIEEVRRIQHLMLLCSLLPPDGKLVKALRLALSLHEEPLLARIRPVPDLHPYTTKSWLESIWLSDRVSELEISLRDGVSDLEAEMVAWQTDKPSMDTAAEELRNVERQLGARLVAEKLRLSEEGEG